MPGVKIGDGAIIAAYSVVVKELRFRWWDYAPEKLVEILPLLCDPDLTKVKMAIQELL